jgi:hypothetical protein
LGHETSIMEHESERHAQVGGDARRHGQHYGVDPGLRGRRTGVPVLRRAGAGVQAAHDARAVVVVPAVRDDLGGLTSPMAGTGLRPASTWRFSSSATTAASHAHYAESQCGQAQAGLADGHGALEVGAVRSPWSQDSDGAPITLSDVRFLAAAALRRFSTIIPPYARPTSTCMTAVPFRPLGDAWGRPPRKPHPRACAPASMPAALWLQDGRAGERLGCCDPRLGRVVELLRLDAGPHVRRPLFIFGSLNLPSPGRRGPALWSPASPR